jgi:DNA-binding NarL/FixJ family response regulator
VRLGARGLAEEARSALAAPSPHAAPVAASPADPPAPHASLTPREIEVLALVAQGISNQEIGDRLFISAFTVKRHIANILTKLDLPTRAAAAAYAIRERLVQ